MRNETLFESNISLNPTNAEENYSKVPHIMKRYLRLIKNVAEMSNFNEHQLANYTESIAKFLDQKFHKTIRLEAAHTLMYICICEMAITSLAGEDSIDLPMKITNGLFTLINDCLETSTKVELLKIVKHLSKMLAELNTNGGKKVPGQVAQALMQVFEGLVINSDNEIMVFQGLLESIEEILLESELIILNNNYRESSVSAAVKFLNMIVENDELIGENNDLLTDEVLSLFAKLSFFSRLKLNSMFKVLSKFLV